VRNSRQGPQKGSSALLKRHHGPAAGFETERFHPCLELPARCKRTGLLVPIQPVCIVDGTFEQAYTFRRRGSPRDRLRLGWGSCVVGRPSTCRHFIDEDRSFRLDAPVV